MAEAKSAGSRADTVSMAIREDILAGRLEPGARLTFPALSAEHGVSVGVLREALARLVDRGIVRSQPNLGFRALPVSTEALAELEKVRVLVEPLFVRQSVLEGPLQWETDIVAARHRLERTPFFDAEGRPSNADWCAAHTAFHIALTSGTGSARILEIMERMRDETTIHHRWVATYDSDTVARMAAEHHELAEAALAHDAERATDLMRAHIESALHEATGGPLRSGSSSAASI
ncbi:GntR family transcriptional regulator [Streptomyces sp. NPDC048445]|uniref:GntR family transcriptional regulator n=1 Tax=Streptomyces sp. NPDC048445 TaxID=3365553 RepID=UPI003720EA36